MSGVPNSLPVCGRTCQDSPSLGNWTIPHRASRAHRVTELVLVRGSRKAGSQPPIFGGTPMLPTALHTEHWRGPLLLSRSFETMSWVAQLLHTPLNPQTARRRLHSSVGEAGREEQFQPLHMSQSKSKQHNHCRKGVKPALFIPS